MNEALVNKFIAVAEALPLDDFADERKIDAAAFKDHCNEFLRAMSLAREALEEYRGSL